MPRIICTQCQVAYKPEKNGVIAEEMNGPDSYKLWLADLWKCPGCGHKVVAGFGARNFAEHYEKDYQEMRARMIKDRGEPYRFY